MTITDPIEVLRRIVNSACDVKGRAALSHLPSHRIWVRRLHEALASAMKDFKDVESVIASLLANESKRTLEARGGELSLFCSIVPRLLQHQSAVLEKLLHDVELVPTYRRGEGDPRRTFRDFNALVTSVRQFVDTTIQTGFQLAALDAREFNFHVLNSLTSFVELATESLQAPFMTEELLEVLNAYEALSWHERKNSSFTGTRAERFGRKVDFIQPFTARRFHDREAESMKALFRFSSEFTHVGHISTLVTSTDPAGIYLGSEEDCFHPSTENFVELEFVLFKGCIVAFADFFFAGLRQSLVKLIGSEAIDVCNRLDEIAKRLVKTWKGTGWQKMFMFVSAARVRAKECVIVKCICGETWTWGPPHFGWDMYCDRCGTTYRAVPIWSDFGYVILPQGPADVFGSPQPIIDDLTEADRGHLYAVWTEFRNSSEVRQFGQRYEVPLLFVRTAKDFKRSMPERRNHHLVTFLDHESLVEGNGITIMCNCTYVTLLLPPIEKELIECWACGSTLKLLALDSAKDSGPFFPIAYHADGSPLLCDVQGSFEKKLCEYSTEERAKLTAKTPPLASRSETKAETI